MNKISLKIGSKVYYENKEYENLTPKKLILVYLIKKNGERLTKNMKS